MKKKERGSRRTCSDAKLEMTPMIDVVFLLLMFFIVTIKPVDILADLNVNRPATPITPPPDEITLFRVDVTAQGYLLNGSIMSLSAMENIFSQTVALNPDEPVIIACSNKSLHAQLVQLLDLCAKLKLKKLSLLSL